MRNLILLILLFAGYTTSATSYCTPIILSPVDLYTGAYPSGIVRLSIAGHGTSLVDSGNIDSTGYLDLTSLSVNLYAGAAYTVSVQINTSTSTPMNMQVWIDYDNNGSFDSSETLYGINRIAGTAFYTMNVPYWAPTGTHSMRVATANDSAGRHLCPNIDPCLPYYYIGEARDYTVTIVAPTASIPCASYAATGHVTSTRVTNCAADSVTFTAAGASIMTGVSFQWFKTWTSSAFISIPGATNTTFTEHTPYSSFEYRVQVTCAYGGYAHYSNRDTIIPSRIEGYIGFAAAVPDTASVKVILYTQSSSTGLYIPIDSMNTCNDAGRSYYYFDHPAGNIAYITKALTNDVTATSSNSRGYIPTYHTSKTHWYRGTSPYYTHADGNTDTMSFTLAYGNVAAGSNTITGTIYTSNVIYRSTDAGAANELVLLEDGAGNSLAATYTNATGNYTFTGIADGTYIIRPEEINFNNVAHPAIAVAAGSTGTASFIRDTSGTYWGTIKPLTLNVDDHQLIAGITAGYSNGSITLNLTAPPAPGAQLMLYDMFGKTVISTAITPQTGNNIAVRIPDVAPGVYLLRFMDAQSVFAQQIWIGE